MDGMQVRSRLDDAEIREVLELVEICEEHDQISISLNIPLVQNVYLFYVNNNLVGFLGMYIMSESGGVEISGMVHPAHRRKQIATTLLSEAKKKLAENHAQPRLIVCDHSSYSGKKFIETNEWDYQYSKYRMVLDQLLFQPLSKKTLDLRPIESYDIPVAKGILQKCFGHTEDEATRLIERNRKNKDDCIYLAKLGIWSIGLAAVSCEDVDLSIPLLAVQPMFQGKGYGKQILSQCIEQIGGTGTKTIKLEVETDNVNQLGLYKSCGFRVIGTYDYYSF